MISTGSRVRLDNTPGLQDSRPLTHVEALELNQVPRRLVVLGGGYIGLEMAQAFRRLGSRVTVVERNETLIHREDSDVTAAIEDLLRRRSDGTFLRRVRRRRSSMSRSDPAPAKIVRKSSSTGKMA